MTEQLQADYLDRYEGVQAQIHQACQFDDSSAVHTIYLGRIKRSRKKFPKCSRGIFNHRSIYKVGSLLDATDHKILLDSGATKSFMSKLDYLRNKSLLGFPKLSSKTKVIQVGNGESINILFIISIIITI